MMDFPTASKHPDDNIRRTFDDLLKYNPKNKKKELEKLIDMGCTEAMVCLGVLLVDGEEKERSRAPKLFMKAAESGDDMGMRNMGYCYALGLGVEKDKTKAAEWYRRSAVAGNAKAQCNLGVMYAHGNGVEEDQGEAAKWFKLSSENGYARGQTNYGIHLLEGMGIDRDPKEAARQFDLSRSPRANHRLAEMYIGGVGVEANTHVALALLEMSSSKGYAKSMFLLAALIEEEHTERAYDLYRQAAAKGNEDAVKRLNDLEMTLPQTAERKRRKKRE